MEKGEIWFVVFLCLIAGFLAAGIIISESDKPYIFLSNAFANQTCFDRNSSLKEVVMDNGLPLIVCDSKPLKLDGSGYRVKP